MSCSIQISDNKYIGHHHPCFIIAEIGQNHQGDINIAKKLIKEAKDSGADCVKFQKSCLSEKYNKNALERPYSGFHSWGKTYGEHKRYLEFSMLQFKDLQKFSQDIGIIFSASAMDKVSVDDLCSLQVPFIKIGSGDANNFPLLEYAAKKHKPLIISTGMQGLDTVKVIYKIMKQNSTSFGLLHCISSYPVPVNEINLRVINSYKKEFPDVPIGYSGHEMGIAVSTAAVTLGAKILERHITLDRSWKGSDHACSLTPRDFSDLIKNVKEVEKALGSPTKKFQNCELPCYKKLGKTLVASRDIPYGKFISLEDISVKVAEPKGLPGEQIFEIVGKKIVRNIAEDESIFFSDIS